MPKFSLQALKVEIRPVLRAAWQRYQSVTVWARPYVYAAVVSRLGALKPRSHVARNLKPSNTFHASAAFGIAFAVFFFDRLVGSIFLTAACVIGVGRVFIGAHYPMDVVAGCLVGLGSALLVARVSRTVIERIVRVVERVTDPLVASLWRLLPSR